MGVLFVNSEFLLVVITRSELQHSTHHEHILYLCSHTELLRNIFLYKNRISFFVPTMEKLDCYQILYLTLCSKRSLGKILTCMIMLESNYRNNLSQFIIEVFNVFLSYKIWLIFQDEMENGMGVLLLNFFSSWYSVNPALAEQSCPTIQLLCIHSLIYT